MLNDRAAMEHPQLSRKMQAAQLALAERMGARLTDDERDDCAGLRGLHTRDYSRLALVETGHGDSEAGDIVGRAVSTQSLPILLGGAIDRVLHDSYSAGQSAASYFCGRLSLNSFREVKGLRVAVEAPEGMEVPDGGELPHGRFVEASESVGLKTYGFTIGATRQQLINDDLLGIATAAKRIGRSFAVLEDRLVASILTEGTGNNGPMLGEDGKQLFSTTHAQTNLLTGAGSALSSFAMAAAKTAFRKVRGPGGAADLIGNSPRYLILPPDLEFTGLTLINSSQVIIAKSGTTDSETVMGSANPHAGSLQPIVMDALTNTTAWYVAADPELVPHIVLCDLRGVREPTVERIDPQHILGTAWRVYFDLGVGVLDWRGIQKNAGV